MEIKNGSLHKESVIDFLDEKLVLHVSLAKIFIFISLTEFT